MKIPVLRVRGADGVVVTIPAIVGPRGEPGVGMENITASDVKCADGKTVEEKLLSEEEIVDVVRAAFSTWDGGVY